MGGGANPKSTKTSSLPTAYIVQREVMFSQVSVCSGGGGRSIPARSSRDGVPLPGPAGGGNPSQVQTWDYPGQEWSTPWAGMGYPNPLSPPAPGIGQQMDYLIRCGRYASCVHAGGLSCCRFLMNFFYRFYISLYTSLFLDFKGFSTK